MNSVPGRGSARFALAPGSLGECCVDLAIRPSAGDSDAPRHAIARAALESCGLSTAIIVYPVHRYVRFAPGECLTFYEQVTEVKVRYLFFPSLGFCFCCWLVATHVVLHRVSIRALDEQQEGGRRADVAGGSQIAEPAVKGDFEAGPRGEVVGLIAEQTRRVVDGQPVDGGGLEILLFCGLQQAVNSVTHHLVEHADVLAQSDGAGVRGLAVVGIVQPGGSRRAVFCGTDVHTGLELVGEGEQLDPLDAERETGARGSGREHGRSGAVGEHPAQEFGIVREAFLAHRKLVFKAAGFKEAAGKLAGADQSVAPARAGDLQHRRLDGHHAAGANLAG